MAKISFHTLPYVDDFCGVERNFDATLDSFNTFESLTAELGHEVLPEKTSFPNTVIDWLGYHLDSNIMSSTIQQDKLWKCRLRRPPGEPPGGDQTPTTVPCLEVKLHRELCPASAAFHEYSQYAK